MNLTEVWQLRWWAVAVGIGFESFWIHISGDIGDKDKFDPTEVENMRTGLVEKRDAVWARKQGMKSSKYEDIQDVKVGSRQCVSDRPNSSVIQNIQKRIGKFVTWLVSFMLS